jgi:hypothetical protein
VRAAERAIKERWHRMFVLAWSGRGFSINLNTIPDYALDWVLDWAEKESSKSPTS